MNGLSPNEASTCAAVLRATFPEATAEVQKRKRVVNQEGPDIYFVQFEMRGVDTSYLRSFSDMAEAIREALARDVLDALGVEL